MRNLFAFLALLAFALPAVAQVGGCPNGCGCEVTGVCTCQGCAVPAAYTRAAEQAVRDGKPLVVFLSCLERPIAGAVTCQVNFLPGYRPPAVIVCRPRAGWLDEAAVLPAGADGSAIRAKAFPAPTVSLPRPAPTYRPVVMTYAPAFTPAPTLGGFAAPAVRASGGCST